MSEPNLDRIQQAWLNATDNDVLRALSARDDYPPQVHMIIQTEAKRRGLSLDMCVRPALRPPSIAKRAGKMAIKIENGEELEDPMDVAAFLLYRKLSSESIEDLAQQHIDCLSST